MKVLLAAFFVCLSIIITNAGAFAGSDDAEWIAECVEDNKHASVPVEVITRYCTCMNNKMSDSETQSITEWEKAHPRERAECDKEAGWR
jgi:hypothetical protein